MARTTKTTVEVEGRTFEISAFDAFTGSYIAFTLFEKIIPMGVESSAGLSGKLPAGRQLMTKEEFFSFQKDCLSVVKEVLKAGPRPVLHSNGSWGVEDIKDNTALVLLLTVQALAFNVKVFMEGGSLKALVSSIQAMMPSATPTSTLGSSPR